jgi:hypothetical protein
MVLTIAAAPFGIIDHGLPANRNVPNGVKPVLSVIGGPPPGTHPAFEAGVGFEPT